MSKRQKHEDKNLKYEFVTQDEKHQFLPQGHDKDDGH